MTNKYDNVYINDSYSIAGMYESDGPLKKYFDRLYDDDMYFGEKSFDVEYLCRINDKGQAYINILRLTDIQSKPKLFSTFMLCLLA